MGCTINRSIKANFPELKVTIKVDFSQKEQQITLLQVTRGLFQAPPVRGFTESAEFGSRFSSKARAEFSSEGRWGWVCHCGIDVDFLY